MCIQTLWRINYSFCNLRMYIRIVEKLVIAPYTGTQIELCESQSIPAQSGKGVPLAVR